MRVSQKMLPLRVRGNERTQWLSLLALVNPTGFLFMNEYGLVLSSLKELGMERFQVSIDCLGKK
ncbi:hypothetical protein GCE9029_00764 [Grimontia celer]|uniref:Uncharacterized protein n=1 Tax=Grimontia celer TaxID=1796497 RepID=A0A128EVV9_9GAMM|nr:hypothetical protein GCE9029_00764 [Grimontia celer]